MKEHGGYNIKSFKAKYNSMDKDANGKISKAELVDAVVEAGRERNLFGPHTASKKPITNGRANVDFNVADDPNEAPVDAKIFREGLSCLGKTFNNARHAYLKLNINERGLTTLKGIGRYTYL